MMTNRLPYTSIALLAVLLVGGWQWWQKHQEAVRNEAKYAEFVKANQSAAKGREVINLYTATWCGYCNHLKETLDASGVPYVDHDIETSNEGKSFFESKKFIGIPVTVVGSEIVEGYDAERLDSVLDRAGYKVGGL